MKKEKVFETETAAEIKETFEKLAKEENKTPTELMSEAIVDSMIREDDDLMITQETTGEDGEKSIFVGTEKPMRFTMKFMNNLTENEIEEVLETLKKGGIYKTDKNFETEYRVATKEDLAANKKNAKEEADELIKELEIS
ncbi:MAG TPA: hypothetical protein VFC76_01295 [Oscillospiraceae bacterium]|nr:hypothetical protein [Oscillospiraceae bacterium]